MTALISVDVPKNFTEPFDPLEEFDKNKTLTVEYFECWLCTELM